MTISMVRPALAAGNSPDIVLPAISEVDRAVVERSEAAKRREPGSNRGWYGLGATVDGAVFTTGRAHLAHVGDGSILRFRDGRVEEQTIVHSLANEYRRSSPGMTDDELSALPDNVIVRAVEMSADIVVHRRELVSLPGDIWVLCSSRFRAQVSEERIASILCRSGTACSRTKALMAAASVEPSAAGDVTVLVHVAGDLGVATDEH